jgi:hypothetical protein
MEHWNRLIVAINAPVETHSELPFRLYRNDCVYECRAALVDGSARWSYRGDACRMLDIQFKFHMQQI